MEFTCTQENLYTCLQQITPITGKNLSLPILNNILIRAEKSGVMLFSTNLELAVSTRLRAKVDAEGSVTVQGKLFHDFIGLQAQGAIHFVVKDQDVHITSNTSKTVLKGIPVEEFPVIPTIEKRDNSLTISAHDLRTCLEPVLPAIAPNDNRPELSGVYFQCQPNKLTIAGTDSYRLAEYILPIPHKATGSYILPLRSVQEVLRIFGEEELTLTFTENQFLCTGADSELISRLIEGSYPDYREIIPKEEKTTISIKRDECVQAVKSASLFCKTGINDIEISTNKKDKLLVIVAANNQVGENISTLPAVITGDDASIVFNYRYVLDALSSIGTEDVILSLTDANTTGVFRPSDTTPLIHLIMPIRQ